MTSLDPRVQRLPQLPEEIPAKESLDQFPTYEVFVKPKEGKPFQHEGIVHAPDLEMAFILAKESLTRRFQCVSIFVVNTQDVVISAFTENDDNIYDRIEGLIPPSQSKRKFEIFHLLKRGKQHVHAGEVEAASKEDVLAQAKKKFGSIKVLNVWAIPSEKIRYTKTGEAEIWNTLPDKKFRDAGEYKGGEKLKKFLEMNK
jgi:ring-1,2-phenylacetyl-CoA epoxidase subunit PaaB